MAEKKPAPARKSVATPRVVLPTTFPIAPRGDRVIVKMQKGVSTTPGGIVLPDAAQEKSQIVTIVAVGPGRRTVDGVLVPMDLEVGQKVFVHTFAGSPIDANTDLGIAAETYSIMREEDVIATL